MIKKKIKEICQDFSDLDQRLLPELADQGLEDILICLTKIHTETSIICMKLELSDSKRIVPTSDSKGDYVFESQSEKLELNEQKMLINQTSTIKEKLDEDASKPTVFQPLEQYSMISDFIAHEEEFCDDLQVLLPLYQSRLSLYLSREQFKYLVGNLDSISRTHLEILNQLLDLRNNSSHIKQLGEVLVSYEQFFKCDYYAYASSYPAAMNYLNKLIAENLDLADCLSDLKISLSKNLYKNFLQCLLQ